MLGAKRLSLYGPDTELAFGPLGFPNIIGWADPERALAGGLVTSGKPVIYPEMVDLWNLMRTIGRKTPKAAYSPLGLDPVSPRVEVDAVAAWEAGERQPRLLGQRHRERRRSPDADED